MPVQVRPPAPTLRFNTLVVRRSAQISVSGDRSLHYRASKRQLTGLRKDQLGMSISIDEYVDVAERATALGCLLPATIAIMPENFDTATTRDEFVVRAEGATLQTLFRNFDYPITSFRPAGERSVAIHNKSADWEATLFVAASLISNNPDLPSMMLELIKRYLQEFFKSEPTKRVKISVVSEKTSKSATKKTYKKLTYEGDIEGLTTLKDAINDVVND